MDKDRDNDSRKRKERDDPDLVSKQRSNEDRDGKKSKNERAVEDPASNGSKSNGVTENAKKKTEPLSLEALLKKKTEQDKELTKPVFLTKTQREALAIQKREVAVTELRKKQVEDRAARLAAMDGSVPVPVPAPAQSPTHTDTGDRYKDRRDRDHRDRDRDHRDRDHRDRDRDRRDSRDHYRDRDRDNKDRGGRDRGAKGDSKEGKVDKEKVKELDAIKAQYLGLKKEKKKVLKPSEKFKFTFDWAAEDDTSRDLNPLYNNPHQAQLLFGRGLRAGIDPTEQIKASASTTSALASARSGSSVPIGGLDEGPEVITADERKALVRSGAIKDTHWSEKKVDDMTERDWRIFREDFNIATRGTKVARPMRNWKEASLPDTLMDAVNKAGYKKPSPIQMQCIPIGLQRRDIIGVAETGSGKTAAFVFPMLVYISKLPKMTPANSTEGPYALILAPTRELAQQIEDECTKFATCMGIRCYSVVGGVPIEEQGFGLREGTEIIIATPGRLNDCLERRYIVLNQCNYVVLDECDRMLDMGFEPQVNTILDAMPSTNLKPENMDEVDETKKVYRQTIMFSATMPPNVERLAKKYLRNPIVVQIGEVGRTVTTIKQRVEFVKEQEKRNRLKGLLRSGPEPPVMVFVSSKKGADVLARYLEKEGIRATVLHGGRTQDQRETALEGFKSKKYDVLVATDVAGRGIDIKGVNHVINFDMPKNIEDYTHRVGRTGRAGASGTATTFITAADTDIMYDLKQMLINTNNPVPAELANHEAAQGRPGERPTRRPDTVYAKK